MNLKRKFSECQEAFLVTQKKPQNLGKAIHCRSREACKVGGFAHGLTIVHPALGSLLCRQGQ